MHVDQLWLKRSSRLFSVKRGSTSSQMDIGPIGIWPSQQRPKEYDFWCNYGVSHIKFKSFNHIFHLSFFHLILCVHNIYIIFMVRFACWNGEIIFCLWPGSHASAATCWGGGRGLRPLGGPNQTEWQISWGYHRDDWEVDSIQGYNRDYWVVCSIHTWNGQLKKCW